MKLKLLLTLLMISVGAPAYAQCSGQPASGLVCGNSSASMQLPAWNTLALLFDRGIGSTQGTVLNRGASSWSATATPSLGKNGGAGGAITLNGSTSGSSTIGVKAAAGTSVFNLPAGNGSPNFVLITDGSGNTSWVSAGSGTVSSVALALPSSILTVSGSPVTSTGTLTGTLATQSANTVWSGPSSGSAATPTFRSLVGADLPNPSPTTLGGVESLAAVSSNWIRSISTSGVPSSSQPAFTDISGSVAATQLPNPTATTLGGVESLASAAHQWINQISTSGVPSATQPAFSDLSGNASLGQLPAIGNNTILSNISGGTAQPAANGPSSLIDTIGSAQGDVLYRGPSGWNVLAPGTSGQVLSTNGASANPAWTTISGTGTVTSVATGAGLTGGAITSSGTVSLAPIATGNVLANTSGSSAAPTATVPSSVLDVIGSTEGDILYRGASSWNVLAPGSSGQFLQTQGSGSTPQWAAAVTGPGSSTSLDCATFSGTSGTVIADLGGCPIIFASISALRSNTSAIKAVYVLGYTSVSDGGEGILNYVASDTTTIDNNCTIFVDASNHRFYRTAANGSVNVKWCGAKGDGSTTDTTAINEAIAIACDGHNTVANPSPFVNGVAFFPPGNYVVDGGINVDNYNGGHITSGCNLQGSGNTATVLQTKTGATNNMLEIIGTSAVTVKDMWIRAATGTTVSNVAVIALSTTQPCNVIRFDNVSMDTLVNVNTVLTDYGCTEVLFVNSGQTNYATGTHVVTALLSTNIYGASANSSSGATIGTGTQQAGGWNFLNNQIHDQSPGAGTTSTVIPLAVQGGNAPNNYFGGIVAGSVAAGTGGSVTLLSGNGALTNLAFHGTNFYADNGTQSGYVFYPNANVSGLTFDGCLLHATTAVMAAITGVTYSSIHVQGNQLTTPVFAPPSGNNGALTSSFIDALGSAINMGSSGTISHSVITNPGTITGTQTSNGVF